MIWRIPTGTGNDGYKMTAPPSPSVALEALQAAAGPAGALAAVVAAAAAAARHQHLPTPPP